MLVKKKTTNRTSPKIFFFFRVNSPCLCVVSRLNSSSLPHKPEPPSSSTSSSGQLSPSPSSFLLFPFLSPSSSSSVSRPFPCYCARLAAALPGNLPATFRRHSDQRRWQAHPLHVRPPESPLLRRKCH